MLRLNSLVLILLLLTTPAFADIEVTGTFNQKGTGTFPIVYGNDIDDTTSTSGSLLISDGDLFVENAVSGDMTINSSGVTAVSTIGGDAPATFVPANETDAAHDTCAEITNCVPNSWDADGDITADEISESKINFVTACAAGSHYYLSGNDLACETDDDTTYTAGDALTLTGTDFDFDGGVAPGGELGGTWASPTIDDSLAVTSWNLTTPIITTSIDLPAGAINTATEIAGDIITHTQILDSDQTDTKCIWFENPTAADDFESIWANKTANNFQVTEIWAESDQTVTFMLQLDDGTPADCDTVDIAPAAGEAEDTSLNGDCLVAAGEELDLDLVSVASTPTWVSICWTGNWVD